MARIKFIIKICFYFFGFSIETTISWIAQRIVEINENLLSDNHIWRDHYEVDEYSWH